MTATNFYLCYLGLSYCTTWEGGRNSAIFCFLRRRWFIVSHMFFLSSFWPWMCLSLVSVYKCSRIIRLKLWLPHSPLTRSYGCGSPFPANFYEQLHLKAIWWLSWQNAASHFPSFVTFLSLHKIISTFCSAFSYLPLILISFLACYICFGRERSFS